MIPYWLPDWRDADAYPEAPGTSATRWAWEFLRRNPDYQRDYAEWRALDLDNPDFMPESASDPMYLVHCEPPALEGELFGEYNRRCCPHKLQALSRYLGEKWGLDLVCDPAASSACVRFSASHSPPMQIDRGYSVKVNWAHMKPERPGEVVVKLRLDQPLDQQIDRLRSVLEVSQRTLQENGVITVPTKRKREVNYHDYLRLLDAEVSGAKPGEMAEVLFPHLPNEYANDNGIKRVRDSLNAASALRDGDYRYLLLRSGWRKFPK